MRMYSISYVCIYAFIIHTIDTDAEDSYVLLHLAIEYSIEYRVWSIEYRV